jgi:hypothetical protein
MLRVSIHAGPLRTMSRFNRLDWLDIGYNELGPLATYKVVLFKIGEGVVPPVYLPSYPLWSSSLWDLTARAIARSLYPEARNPEESVPPTVPALKRPAFAETLCAVIEHIPNSGVAVSRLASVEIDEDTKVRCLYRARISEDLQTTKMTEPFSFAPKFLQPAELVLRALLFSMTGDIDAMPVRPSLNIPTTRTVGGQQYVAIHKLLEPARTGLLRWLARNKRAPIAHPTAPEGLALWETFQDFLSKAI